MSFRSPFTVHHSRIFGLMKPVLWVLAVAFAAALLAGCAATPTEP